MPLTFNAVVGVSASYEPTSCVRPDRLVKTCKEPEPNVGIRSALAVSG